MLETSIDQVGQANLATNISLLVIGRIAIVNFISFSLPDANWNWTTVATLPEQYRPLYRCVTALKGERESNTNGAFYAANAQVMVDGTVQINPGNYANRSLSGQLVYIIA